MNFRLGLFWKNKNKKKVGLRQWNLFVLYRAQWLQSIEVIWSQWGEGCGYVGILHVPLFLWTGGTGHSHSPVFSLGRYVGLMSGCGLLFVTWGGHDSDGRTPWASDRGPFPDYHKGCPLWPAFTAVWNQSPTLLHTQRERSAHVCMQRDLSEKAEIRWYGVSNMICLVIIKLVYLY